MTNKKIVTSIAVLMMLTFTITILPLPSATAQQFPRRKTFAYVGAVPNPVGVGQETLIHVGITQFVAEYYGWKGLTVTVTKPDGTTETLGPIKTDPTGGTGVIYVPQMAGNYTLQTHFPEQDFYWNLTEHDYGGLAGAITYEASDSEKLTLVVQQEPVQYYPGVPLPTGFWTRPIDSQLYEWSAISGNWLEGRAGPTNRFAPYNDGPESGHILWTKQIAAGGIVGGEYDDIELGISYEMGDAYEGKALPPVVINGVLYYNRFASNGLPSQGIVAVDLHTGEELWFRNNTVLAFGQVFYWDSFNSHGAFAYLWETSGTTWKAYDAFTGEWVYTMTGVPSGTTIYGPSGEMLRYTVDLNKGWMTLWNSTRVVQQENRTVRNDGSWGLQIGDETAYKNRTYPASRGIMWNVSIPKGLPGNVKQYYPGDMILGSNVIDYTVWASDDPIAIWAISLKPGQTGQLLYNKTWMPPQRDLIIVYQGASYEDNVFIIALKETRENYGFDLRTGQCIWGPSVPMPYQDNWIIVAPLNYYGSFAYGTYYHVGPAGSCYAYDAKTGELKWTYDVKDPYNEALIGTNWPMMIAFITDGKIYLHRADHCPKNPRWRGSPFVCLNATTGEKIFEVNLFSSYYGNHPVIGDSIIAMLNTYDNSFYALGKGPSSITVAIQDDVLTQGDSVLIQGTVTDVSPGTEQTALRLRFPNGVPAVSDASMSEWMQYVYMQFPRPADVTGVEVTISVLDSNNNFREIGKTTANSDGFYSLVWTPDIPGKYTVVASFDGSDSYYSSQANTAFAVTEAPAEAVAAPAPSPSMADTYFVPMSLIIIIAIAVVGALILLILRKR